MREQGWRTLRVDLSGNDAVVVFAGPTLLKNIYVDTVLSAHACPILDNTTTVFSLIASLAAGSLLDFDGMLFETSLQVNSNDAATGVIVVTYKQLGLAGS